MATSRTSSAQSAAENVSLIGLALCLVISNAWFAWTVLSFT